MPNKLGKALKKAGKDVGKAVSVATQQIADAAKVAADQTQTNMTHLNANVQKAVVKNVDLGHERHEARNEIEKFEKDKALAEAIKANGTFDTTIAEMEKDIANASKLYADTESSYSVNPKPETLAKELANVKACITASESSVSKLRETKAAILTSIASANQQYKILQDAPDMVAENDVKVATGKKAAEAATSEAKKVLSLFSQVNLVETLKTTQELLNVTLPKRLTLVTSLIAKLNEEAASKSALDTKLEKDAPSDFHRQFAEMQARQANEMQALMEKMKVSAGGNSQAAQPAIIHQYQSSNTAGSSAGSAAAPIPVASAALGNK